MTQERVPGSFRDPSGFVYRHEGVLRRQINAGYATHYDALMASGLYGRLVERGLLVAHREVSDEPPGGADAYKVIEPEEIPFVSYPYEWSFSQYKAAALATLDIQREALEHDMTLKDASAFNIQFRGASPVLIDTLSFERYQPDRPWVAYRQFCQHFLAPLALMAYRDPRLARLGQSFIDGIPLDLASALLPRRTYARLGLLLHVHLHARQQRAHAGAARDASRVKVKRRGLEGLLQTLAASVAGLSWRAAGTEWAEYYTDTNYSPAAAGAKQRLVTEMIGSVTPALVWDLGANTGAFSRIARDAGATVVAFDADEAAVERNFLRCQSEGDRALLPLVLDLGNPSPALGWAHRERASLAERGPADLVMALALVHHLAISNNTPLDHIASFLASVARHVIVEFVPKDDSQVQRLLASRQDVFPDYDAEAFEAACRSHFTIVRREPIEDSLRILYLLRRA